MSRSLPRPCGSGPSAAHARSTGRWRRGTRRHPPRSGRQGARIDRDHDAIAAARSRLGTDDVEYLEASFAATAALAAIAAFQPDRILLDLGVSSHQIDAAERGFTFRQGAPLDMRMQGGGRAKGKGPYRPRCLEQLARRTARDRLHRLRR